MDATVKAKWVEALRKGEVNDQKVVQTTQVLRYDDREDGTIGLCCLGVLCELAIAEGVPGLKREISKAGATTWYVWADEFDEGDDNWVEYPSEDLPTPVKEWAGLDRKNPHIGFKNYRASIWNDEEGATFAEIADMVEESL
jgi:hypothetical protein